MKARNEKYHGEQPPSKWDVKNTRYPQGKELPVMKNWNIDSKMPRYDEWKSILDRITKTREGYAR